MASDACYQIFAWDDPLVGRDAIRAELLRQAPVWRDLRIEILTIGSVGQIVFTERLDSMILRGRPITSHIAGVYEVDAEGQDSGLARLPGQQRVGRPARADDRSTETRD